MNYQKRELIKIKSYFKIYYLWVIDMIKDDMYKKYIKQENTYHILFKITIKNRGLTGNIKIYKKNV